MALSLLVTGMETDLALRGFRPSLLDSEPRWLEERARARSLGRKALILVGGSRMQLDVDQEVLRRETGLEPVQLALNGTPFYGVFKGLAADPEIDGTVLVDFSDNALGTPQNLEAGAKYENDAEARAGFHLPGSADMEMRLDELLRGSLRSYADGAKPLTTLRERVLWAGAQPQYLTSRPDRSSLADYRRVSMPSTYYRRVSGDLGMGGTVPPGDDAAIQAAFRRAIERLRPTDPGFYREHIAGVAAMVDAIRARGGRVIFVVLPVSGYEREIDDRLCPRAEFWDAFAAGNHAENVNFRDVPALAGYTCPDGSHLDYRDRGRFTTALVPALHLDANAP